MNKIASVWLDRQYKPAAEKALGQIPPDASLLDDNIPWESITELFDQFCSIKFVKIAVATKILHKKRPALIPMIDSVVNGFFKNEQPDFHCSKTPGDHIIRNMKYFRERLLACHDEIETLCDQVAAAGFPITPVRALEVLIWMALEPNGYYRQLE